MRRGLSIAVVVAVAATPAAPAGAAVPEGTPTPQPVTGPVLSGPRVLWLAPTGDRGFALRSAEAGAAPTTLFAGEAGLTPSLAASSERWIVGSGTVVTARHGAAAETFDRRCPSSVPDLLRVVDADGDAVVFPRCQSDGRSVAVVRDYSGPTVVEAAIPAARIAGLRLAGRYVAWIDGRPSAVEVEGDIVVHDRLTGRETYRVTRAAIGGAVHSFDLQADGKVAFSHTAPGGWKLAWAGPADPRPHALPLPARERYEVRIADDRIGFMSAVHPLAGSPSLAEVGVTGLDGPPRTLGDLAEGTVSTDDFDFDGERIAWWSYRCVDAVIRVARADGPAAPLAPRSGCALRFRRPPRVKSASVRLYPDCFGFYGEACEARKVVLTASVGGRRVTVGHGARAARVDLTAAGRALLRPGGRVKVRVSALVTDDARRRERRAGNATLKR